MPQNPYALMGCLGFWKAFSVPVLILRPPSSGPRTKRPLGVDSSEISGWTLNAMDPSGIPLSDMALALGRVARAKMASDP